MKRDTGAGSFADVFGYTASVTDALREGVSVEAERETSAADDRDPWGLVWDAKQALDQFEKTGSFTHVANAKDALEAAIDARFVLTFGVEVDPPDTTVPAAPAGPTDHDTGIDL
jgi:hypothetical protein